MSAQIEIQWSEVVAAGDLNAWHNYRLDQLTEPTKEQYSPDGSDDFIYIGLEHIQQETLRLNTPGISSDVTSNKFKFEPGDILFGKLRPYFRKVVRPSFGGICSTDIWVFRAKEGVDSGFLFYFLANWDFVNLANSGEGGTRMPRADWKFLQATEWKIPPIDEQIAISAVLNSLDVKIDLLLRQNITIEALAKTLFRQWFIAFDFPNIEGEPYHSNNGKMIDSEIGEIPSGWRIGTLNEIISELETGTRPNGGVSSYTSGIPSIGAESIVGIGRFDFAKTKYVPEEYFEKMRRGHIKSRDVLIYKDGGTPGTFKPHISMFGDGFPFDKCCVNDHVYRLRIKYDRQSFAYLWLTSDLSMEEMQQKGTGAAIPGLNSTALKSLTTLMPDQATLTSFEALIEPLFTRIISNSKQVRTLSVLRDTLLPKLMSGEVRVAY